MDGIVRSQYRLPNDVDAWLTVRAKGEERSKNAQLVVELRWLMRRHHVDNASSLSPSGEDTGESKCTRSR
jgi:hypothetical protein